MDKNMLSLLKYLEKLYANHQLISLNDLLERFEERLIFEAEFYNYIEKCGGNGIQITLPGREKLREFRSNQRNFIISVLALLAGLCTLAAQLFQFHF